MNCSDVGAEQLRWMDGPNGRAVHEPKKFHMALGQLEELQRDSEELIEGGAAPEQPLAALYDLENISEEDNDNDEVTCACAANIIPSPQLTHLNVNFTHNLFTIFIQFSIELTVITF